MVVGGRYTRKGAAASSDELRNLSDEEEMDGWMGY